MNSIINIERKFQVSDSLSNGLVINDKIFIIQRHIFFIERRLYAVLLLKFWLIVYGTSINEDIFWMVQSENGTSLKISLPLGDKWKIENNMTYLWISCNVFNQSWFFTVGKKLSIIVDLIENGSKMLERNMKLALYKCSYTGCLFSSRYFNPVFIASLDERCSEGGVKIE
jgi:hypothetical protein